MQKRKKFGIGKLDQALNGGIPEGNIVLVSGGPGTGKSTICLQYLMSGALTGEKGLYVSTEQNKDEILKQAEAYAWPLSDLFEKNMLQILHINILEEEDTFQKVVEAYDKLKPERLVIDSLTTYSDYVVTHEFSRDLLIRRGGVPQRNIDKVIPTSISEKTLTKRMLASMITKIKNMNVTSLLTSELPEKAETLSSDGISEFLADGVITLHHLGVGLTQFRSLQIRKMRYTGHSNDYLGYDFKEHGVEIVEDAV